MPCLRASRNKSAGRDCQLLHAILHGKVITGNRQLREYIDLQQVAHGFPPCRVLKTKGCGAPVILVLWVFVTATRSAALGHARTRAPLTVYTA